MPDAPAPAAVVDPVAAQPATPQVDPGGPEPVLPALTLRDGLPPVTDTPRALAAAAASLAAGQGPIAVDAERASGYRYGQRAYLVQVRREGAGSFLVDPIAVPDLSVLAAAMAGTEWILHSASQDLPCLAEVGLVPASLFDTELAGRLLGMERVGLAPMVENLLGVTLAKGHGAADWSTRPLPDDWLEYAALDVEVLIELRERLAELLVQADKWQIAQQEFAAVRDAAPAAPRIDPWRRTSGLHRVRTRRGLAVVERLWYARDQLARSQDVASGRILPDSAIVAVAVALPRDADALRAVPGFHGRGAGRHHRTWAAALQAAFDTPDDRLPTAAGRGDGPPPSRAWAQRDPVAAARLARARAALQRRAEQLGMPVENLLTPDLVRRLLWQPPTDRSVAEFLTGGGARPWQVERTADVLEEVLRGAGAAG